MKRCTQCGETKGLTDFYVRRRNNGRPSRSYPSPECKECLKARVREWRETKRTPEQVNRWKSNRRAKKARIKMAVFAAYGGFICACCGETESAFLTIDHVWNDGASWRRATLGSRLATGWRTYVWLFKHGFPAGFQVLCMNCNFGKRINGGECPHSAQGKVAAPAAAFAGDRVAL